MKKNNSGAVVQEEDVVFTDGQSTEQVSDRQLQVFQPMRPASNTMNFQSISQLEIPLFPFFSPSFHFLTIHWIVPESLST